LKNQFGHPTFGHQQRVHQIEVSCVLTEISANSSKNFQCFGVISPELMAKEPISGHLWRLVYKEGYKTLLYDESSRDKRSVLEVSYQTPIPAHHP